MRRSARVSLAWILSICCVFPFAVSAKDWIRAESAHFTAYSNIGESSTRNYLRQLESFKLLAEMLLAASSQSAASNAKFTVYLLNDQEQLDIIRPGFGKNYAGVYIPCSEGANDFSWMSRSTDDAGVDQALVTMQHEYAHHLMFSHLNHFLPRWYVEGFAEYLSTVTLRQGKFDLGSGSSGRVYTLAGNRGWIDFKILLDTKKYMALLKKKEVDEDRFYAQSWLLTHYMLADTNRTKAFNQYFDQIGHGADPVTSFESTTGIAVDKLERILAKYLHSMSHLSISVPDIPDSTIAINKIASEQSDYLLDRAALQTCVDVDRGKQILEKLQAMRSKHRKEPEFNLTLDYAELLFGDITQIQGDLEQIVANDPTNFFAHYLLGRTYFKLYIDAKQTDAASLQDKAKQEFIAAYKLDKLNAVNMFYLAKAFDVGTRGETPSKNLLNAASGATFLMPSVYEYAFLSADVNMRAGDRAQAIRALQPFACNPHNPKQAVGVGRVIAALESGKNFHEAMNAYDEPIDPKTVD